MSNPFSQQGALIMNISPDYDTHELLPWEQPSWRQDVENWLDSVLSERGWQRTGEVSEVQRRPWSVILQLNSSVDSLYFKACSPALMHEPALTRALSLWQPQRVLPLIAQEVDRGWMLMPDGGATLRRQFEAGAPLSTWLGILPVFARLQIDLLPHADELLSLGIIDRRTETLADQFVHLLEDGNALQVDQKEGLTRDEFDRLQREIPVFRRLCSELAECGIPDALEHDDFHDGNIFFSQNRPVFFDWGETCLAHPFFSMVVGLNSIACRFDLEPGGEQWCQLRDAYLQPWASLAGRAALLKAFDLAQQAGAVNRALTWHRVVSSLPLRWQQEDADAVPGWLKIYLERRQRYGNS